jgi:hypothetical protein
VRELLPTINKDTASQHDNLMTTQKCTSAHLFVNKRVQDAVPPIQKEQKHTQGFNKAANDQQKASTKITCFQSIKAALHKTMEDAKGAGNFLKA